MKAPDSNGFDPFLASRVRLALVATLVSVHEADFMDLVQTLKVTKGNLSIQAQNLEEAGYIEIRKTFRGRKPHTSLHITGRGHRALVDHVRRLEGFLKEGGR